MTRTSIICQSYSLILFTRIPSQRCFAAFAMRRMCLRSRLQKLGGRIFLYSCTHRVFVLEQDNKIAFLVLNESRIDAELARINLVINNPTSELKIHSMQLNFNA